jgi:tetratricopeptide (TPR) repeat protein
MKKVILSFAFTICSLALIAQSAEVQARAAFLKAQELYGNGDFTGAVERLENAKKLLGGSNPRIDHLLATSHWELGNVQEAKKAISSYFEKAPDNDANYNTMLLLLADADVAIAGGEKKAKAIASGKQQVYTLDEGQTFKITTATRTTSPDGYGGSIEHTMTMVNAYTVKSAGSAYSITNFYESAGFDNQASGLAKGALNNVAEYWGLFQGKSYDFTMSTQGRIQISPSINTMQSQISAGIDGLKMMKLYKNSLKEGMKTGLDPRYLAATLNTYFPEFPNTIAQGTTWEQATYMTKTEMQGLRAVNTLMPGQIVVKVEDMDNETMRLSMKYKDEPFLNLYFLQGEVTIDRATGLPISGQMIQKIPSVNSEIITTFSRD